MQFLLSFLLVVTSVFLILLVLVQRGRGGGLAGALGGMGGQSAFGAKAGDMFTKITVGVAAFWILLCVLSVKMMGGGGDALDTGLGSGAAGEPTLTAPAETEDGAKPGAAGGAATDGAGDSNE
jgi:preprotein translocase subunit SecG